jgi:hypothetical protein
MQQQRPRIEGKMQAAPGLRRYYSPKSVGNYGSRRSWMDGPDRRTIREGWLSGDGPRTPA